MNRVGRPGRNLAGIKNGARLPGIALVDRVAFAIELESLVEVSAGLNRAVFPIRILCAGAASNQLPEVTFRQTRLLEDLLHQSARNVPAMHRDRRLPSSSFVPERPMAAFLGHLDKAGLLQGAEHFGGMQRREPGHASFGARTVIGKLKARSTR